MAIVDLFSKRKKAAEKVGKPDVYTYDELPQTFRVQVIHIWRDLIGREPHTGGRWRYIHDAVAREKGLFYLGGFESGNKETQCCEHFMQCSTDDALDMIELSFSLMDALCEGKELWQLNGVGIHVPAADAIDELNTRFREHGLGYQFAGRVIIRVDSQYVHSEVVQPALALLSRKPFAKANNEFLTAHRHYREGHYKDCVVAANRAFETTLKTICAERKWTFGPGDRSSELITVVRNNGLFPSYLDKGLDTYVAMLKTGLPGVRNSAGGHGDGPAAPPVPGYIAAYALHLTASNIVLVVEAFNALP